MKKILIPFTRNLIILTLGLGLLTFVFTLVFRNVQVTPSYPYILIFLFLFSWAAFYVTAKSMLKQISRFANTYMIVNFLKLVIFSLLLLIYGYLNRTDAASFIITFFVYYGFYTVLEVLSLKMLDSASKKS